MNTAESRSKEPRSKGPGERRNLHLEDVIINLNPIHTMYTAEPAYRYIVYSIVKLSSLCLYSRARL